MRSPVSVPRRTFTTDCQAPSRERVADVEKIESPEAAIVGIQRLDAMLPQQRSQMRVGNEIASRRDGGRRGPVDVPEPLVFDRATGEPVWPIEKRPVSQSPVPGERTSPTQPFPAKPPVYLTNGSLEADLIDFTEALRAEALEIYASTLLERAKTPGE